MRILPNAMRSWLVTVISIQTRGEELICRLPYCALGRARRYNPRMQRRSHFLLLIAVGLFVLTGPPLHAQPGGRFGAFRGGVVDRARDQFALTELSPTVYVDEVSGEVGSQIERANQFAKAEQWDDLLEMLVRISDSTDTRVTNSLESVTAGDERYVALTTFVNQQLARISANAPEVYAKHRTRVDPLAQQWLKEAQNRRDSALLKKIVRRYLHSDAADDALLSLGDMALENGNTESARRYWSQIHWQLQWQNKTRRLPYWQRAARGEVASSVLRDIRKTPQPIDFDFGISSYVSSDIPLADIWARLTLASILEGNHRRAQIELAFLRSGWKDAEGVIGGRTGNYLKALSALAVQCRGWKFPDGDDDWLTFAGSATRNTVTATEIEIPTMPSWRVPLEAIEPVSAGVRNSKRLPQVRPGESHDGATSHFPVVVGKLVFVHDKNRIRCLNISDGKPAWSNDEVGAFYSMKPREESNFTFFDQRNTRNQRIGEPRFTLSAAGSTLVATLGANLGSGGSGNAALMGFDLKTEGSVRFGPVEVEDETWTFQGAPVCEQFRCWVGLRQRNSSSQDYVVSFDMTTGEELWRTKVCSADTIGHGAASELSNYLLTKHEETIYFSSHLGTIAALDAETGRLRWVTKYARRGPTPENLNDQQWHALRDLTPCVYYDGLLIIAPSDADKLLAYHAGSGRKIWETPLANDANQILGVSDEGHLIVSGRRLWWLDVYTGELSQKVEVNPFPSSDRVSPSGAGRGVLSGGHVYWPTSDEGGIGKIYVLSQATGKAIRQAIDLEEGNVSPGNLIVTGTHLLIASPQELAAYPIE